MLYGASTANFYPMHSEDSLRKQLEMGYRHFEFFINCSEEAGKDFLKLMKSMTDEYGATFSSVHPFTSAFESMLFFSDYDRRTEEGLDFYRKFFEAAAYLGAKLIVLHGQKESRNGGFSFSDEFYAERYMRLFEVGEEYGITLCQENVRNFRSHSIENIKKLGELTNGKAKFVFDIKQCILSHEDPYEMLEAMGKNLMHVHLSDSSEYKKCLLPGAGCFDIKKLIDYLSEKEYKGSVICEVYRHSFNEEKELKNSLNYMKNLGTELIIP